MQSAADFRAISPGARYRWLYARARISFDNEFQTRWYSDLARAVNTGHEGQPWKRDAERVARRRDSERGRDRKIKRDRDETRLIVRVDRFIYVPTYIRAYTYIYIYLCMYGRVCIQRTLELLGTNRGQTSSWFVV